MSLAQAVVLPDEEDDLTTSELHERLLRRLFAAVRYALRGKALVLADIFVRVGGVEQGSPDLLVAPLAPEAARRVYSVPDEAVPLVTVEVMSYSNHHGEGRRKLESKRAIFGRIGVGCHIEVDPERGVITIWENQSGVLVRTSTASSYEGPDLGGVRIECPRKGEFHIYWPDGQEVGEHDADKVRADTQQVRADTQQARADTQQARADRLAARLRLGGIDPDQL